MKCRIWSFNPMMWKSVMLVLLLSFSCLMNSSAQDRVEIGGFLGSSYYLGDLNPGTQFRNSHFAFGGIGRYVFTDRVVVKATAILGGLSGEYPRKNVRLVESSTDSYSFHRKVFDVAAMLEYNFLSYDHQFMSNTTFTPYVTFGLASTTYRRYSNDINSRDEKPVFVLSLPFGLGVKYKLTDWIRVGAEWTYRKTFVDDLDVDSYNNSVNPADPYGFNEEGGVNNNDWYSFAGIYVTFNLFRRNSECNSGF